ncbi:ParA family protein [Polaromonas naphthalenivorans]|uniref:Cobyrinic acid a,c-diamide synthase n=1 Tax=Polaromonas naphthalenivorans (strain CJ2) TaxID=365044 RepID=A1VWT0_POLNA|nr:AAA family ATPase [Polaromonas naphthalenivorans]ABM40108.1 Cobyrinic acid a,c-diamide synthase [Polaromonas naphthalenivorans CJ2]
MANTSNISPRPSVSIAELAAMRTRAHEVVSQNRAAAAAPSAQKVPPEFNSAQVAELCGIDRNKLEHRRRKGGLPDGREEARRRMFTLKEAQEWVLEYRHSKSKRGCIAAGQMPKAVVIAAGNFKGGVGKSTTAATLAQGLSLRGHKVLVIDTDPQGSLTSLMGVAPETLEDEDTILNVASGDAQTLADAIRPTYWSNIHLIGAAPRISGAQFHLPARAQKDGVKFWSVLSNGLDEDILDLYDVVIIDTPPALDYLTINAFYAADILMVPLPPSAMDFVSSTQFWDLFVDLNEEFAEYGMQKEYSFVNVLLSRVDANDTAAALVREWITEAYGKHLLPIEIPSTAAAKTAAAEFGTVYDATVAQQSARTYRRAYEAYERLIEITEDQLVRVWQSQGKE